MVKREITVVNSLGIHARPASLIVQTAGNFSSRISIEKDGITADCRSIMSVMVLAAAFNSKIIIKASGEDEEDAANAVARLFEEKFNEE